MVKNYTNEHIDKFFEHFKRLPDYFELDKVRQLVNNPDAKAKLSGNSFIKPLNLIIMTTFIIAGLTILIGLLPNKEDHNQKTALIRLTDSVQIIPDKSKSTISIIEKSKLVDARDHNKQFKPESKKSGMNTTIAKNKELTPANCNWPKDTMLNKQDLFIHLTEPERERVGLFYLVDSTKKPAMDRYKKLYKDGICITVGGYSRSKHPNLKYTSGFNVRYVSDTSCTDYRWNSPFYNCIDTLIPVVHLNRIYWFAPVAGVFDSLPDRYQYLKSTYSSLRCLKKKFPHNHYVNYWDKNMILGEFRLLTLSKEELAKIGVIFDNDSNGYKIINPATKKKYYTVRQEMANRSMVSISRDSVFPASMPVLKTDEKARGQYFFQRDAKDFQYIADVLVPVKIPLNEYLKGFDYYDIYWYNPTDSFVTLLPERIRNTLKAEKESILKNTIVSTSNSCIYFEACQSTLHLDDFMIFPNPAIQTVTVQFSVNQDIVGHISLSNMAGVNIKQLTANTNIKSGFHSYQIDLSGLPSGIYLLTVVSDKGFKTKRLIIIH
jgi:hypothetical protein